VRENDTRQLHFHLWFPLSREERGNQRMRSGATKGIDDDEHDE
jgi:hypothetical protein